MFPDGGGTLHIVNIQIYGFKIREINMTKKLVIDVRGKEEK